MKPYRKVPSLWNENQQGC